MTPIDFWTAWWRNATAMTQTGFRLAETAHASTVVIDSRSRTIQAAMQSPLTADHDELSLMASEKVQAFSMAATSAFGDLLALQAEAFAQWQRMIAMAISGRPATTAQWGRLSASAMRMATTANGAGGKALAPIHARATANARRLAPRKSK
jgi:hypothetical protein